MNKQPNRLWVAVLLLGWLFDLLFWKSLLGINFAIFTILVITGGFALLITTGLYPARKSLWLLIPFIFFTLITFIRQEPLTNFLAFVFTFFSMGLLTMTYLGGRWTQYGLSDYVYKSVQVFGSLLIGGLNFFSQVRREQAASGIARRKLPIWPVLRGLVIAFPIVACFASLLASADVIFGQKLNEFIQRFNSGTISDYILQLFWVLCCAYLLAGAFLHAASQSRDEKLLGEDQPLVKPFLGFTEAAIILGSVALLFLAFVFIQFRYFFGGQVNIGIDGFTYSEYARRGFNELLTVAFFSLLLVLGLSGVTRRETQVQRRIYSGLSITLVALVVVMLVSAYQRLTLAILWHGFSRLRIYPGIFMIWVGILLVAVVVLEVLQRERYFAFAAVIASLGFAVSLTFFNVDAAIVNYNIARASEGKFLNVNYLASLSADAVPALADQFLSPSLSTATHEGVGASLVCYLHSNLLYPDDLDQAEDWRSFNLSRWQARLALEQLRTSLESYHLSASRTHMRVRTPGNVLYECRDNGAESRDQ